MLIEAAKGGHANVVNLLLDWSANAAGSQASNSPVEPNQTSPSQLYTLDYEQVNLLRSFIFAVLIKLPDKHVSCQLCQIDVWLCASYVSNSLKWERQVAILCDLFLLYCTLYKYFNDL